MARFLGRHWLALTAVAATIAIGFVESIANDYQWWDAALVIALAAVAAALVNEVARWRGREPSGRGWTWIAGAWTVATGLIQALALVVQAAAGSGPTHAEWLVPLAIALLAIGVAAIRSTSDNRQWISAIAIMLVAGDAVALIVGGDVWRPALASVVAVPAVWFAFALAYSPGSRVARGGGDPLPR
jgi:hypothetical protein